MIVNYKNTGWEIITQRAHGLLAAALAFRWKEKYHDTRWVETLLAIADHDDADCEFDRDDLLTPAGGPINFAMRTFDPKHCRDQAIYSKAKSRHIQLLNSMHLVFLYEEKAGSNAQVRAYIEEQGILQKRLRKELSVTKGQIEKVYRLMQWCDALSLMICQHAIQPEQRMSEISKGPDNTSYQVFAMDKNEFSVEPWPFSKAQFSVSVESRGLGQLQFDSPAQFKKAMNAVTVKENEYIFVEAKRPL